MPVHHSTSPGPEDDKMAKGSLPRIVEADVDFAMLLQESLQRESSWPRDDLLDLDLCSPLTSLESSPNLSPHSAPAPNLPSVPPLTLDAGPTSTISPAMQVPQAVLNSTQKRKMRSKAQSKRKRAKKNSDFCTEPRVEPHQKYVQNNNPTITNLNFEKVRHTKGSYRGMKSGYENKTLYNLSDLVGPGSKNFRYIAWDGRTPHHIVDSKGITVSILAGRPQSDQSHAKEDGWDAAMAEAAQLMENARKRCRASSNTAQESDRGAFLSLRCGISHGGGQTHPQKLCNSGPNERILKGLNEAKPFRRLAGFATSAFGTWAPKLFNYYKARTKLLYSKYPSLPRPFPTSIFCAMTYNLGPHTVCYPHVDLANLPFGLCAIAALGDFDPKKGGHMVLWNCELVIEFPPGSVILIPSAAIAHSNTSINHGAGEKRFSFTQYTAGGLFRWVENGCMTLESYKATLKKEELQQWERDMDARWEFGLSLLPRHERMPEDS